MALTNNREKKICEKYGAYDSTGHVHCNECPLNKGNPNNYDFRCKANSHYNRHIKEWEYDKDGTDEKTSFKDSMSDWQGEGKWT